MARGGSRPGAGRRPGAASRAKQEALEAASAEGETPLEYMLRVMRAPDSDTKRRDAMATAAAPYLHPKLSNVEHKGEGGGPIKVSVVRFDHAPE